MQQAQEWERPIRLERFEDLDVWRRAHALALEVYRLTGGFPSDEKFGLMSQMRRAAVSVPANIAEGFKKRGNKDKANFYNIAQGSLEELRYYFILAHDLGYISAPAAQTCAFDEIGRMLHSLIRVTLARRS
ncbi:MAG: four helix bundle protein [candidate division WOR-3 bacterium]|nr:four helix bundle protein [candidate division WOR-3 bacterium]